MAIKSVYSAAVFTVCWNGVTGGGTGTHPAGPIIKPVTGRVFWRFSLAIVLPGLVFSLVNFSDGLEEVA